MTPDKALELVGNYARLNKAIKDCRKRISKSLDACPCVFVAKPINSKGHSMGANLTLPHLQGWYEPPDRAEYDDYGNETSPEGEWFVPGEEQKAECPHCYAAHLVIQERKALRKQFGHVKRVISRSIE